MTIEQIPAIIVMIILLEYPNSVQFPAASKIIFIKNEPETSKRALKAVIINIPVIYNGNLRPIIFKLFIRHLYVLILKPPCHRVLHRFHFAT